MARPRYVDEECALQLAEASDNRDVAALARMRLAQWAVQERDGRRAVAIAEDALRVPGVSETTRARVHLRAAHGYAITGDAAACQRHLDAVTPLAEPVDTTGAVTAHRLRAYEASCWLWMRRP
jgi:hypothetical protein